MISTAASKNGINQAARRDGGQFLVALGTADWVIVVTVAAGAELDSGAAPAEFDLRSSTAPDLESSTSSSSLRPFNQSASSSL